MMRRVEVTGLAQSRKRLPLVDLFRTSPTARAFDLLRTRLLHTLRERGWKRVGICAPTSGCGASFTAANLALSLSRVAGSRTLLMDLNLRNPGIARAMGLERTALYTGDMQGFLRGDIRLEDHLLAASDSLALGLSSSICANASEILHEMRSSATLDDMMQRTRADVALFDLPAVLEHDDVSAFLPQVDGVLLVSDGSKTTASHLNACENLLAGQTQLLGVVLNRSRPGDGFAAVGS
ncbi:exopolysaccharide biosynthesis protein [Phaeobacter sp. B1627]|uniref:exopolysaccharide biosynthesis protein n=1 Tax=Phaeobacter sp. B1627 TaxID=2583809 RepID=UPI00210688DE|nr:exopolysaccharide biosynthesis protein [Phaeobacter sp. B1627]